MPHLEFELESSATPAAIIAGLTNFTDRRPEIWPGLDAKQYKVLMVGDTWADVREGSASSVWARERYDWSTPGRVRWTVQDSSFSTAGDFVEAVVTPRGTGSTVHMTWSRRGKSAFAKLMVALIVLTRGYLVRRSFAAGLRQIEAGSAVGR
ncbi:MAG: hypothetical protein ACJ77N_07900 [Chloroflexota bacterium]|jgi:hypothetical protein